MRYSTKIHLLQCLLLGLIVSYIYVIYIIVNIPHQMDYKKFYESGTYFFQGESLYSGALLDCIDRESTPPKIIQRLHGPNLNPPFFTLLVLPFAKLTYVHSQIAWLGLSLLAGLISMFLLKRAFKLDTTTSILMSCAFLAYYPTSLNIICGQVGLWLLLPLVGAWLTLNKGYNKTAGILLGFLFSIKIFFGLFILFLVVNRQWRALVWFFITASICALLALLVFGIQAYWDYHSVLHRIYWYSANWNGSLLGFLVRLFGGHEQNQPFINLPQVTQILYYCFSAGLIIFLIKLAWPRLHSERETVQGVGFAFTLVAMLLISPLGWNYYFPFLLIPVLVLLKYAKKTFHENSIISLVCLAIFLSSMPSGLLEPLDINRPIVILFGGSYYCYTLLILAVGLWVIGKKMQRQQLLVNSEVKMPSPLIKFLFIIALMPSIIGSFNIVTTSAKYLTDGLSKTAIMGCVSPSAT